MKSYDVKASLYDGTTQEELVSGIPVDGSRRATTPGTFTSNDGSSCTLTRTTVTRLGRGLGVKLILPSDDLISSRSNSISDHSSVGSRSGPSPSPSAVARDTSRQHAAGSGGGYDQASSNHRETSHDGAMNGAGGASSGSWGVSGVGVDASVPTSRSALPPSSPQHDSRANSSGKGHGRGISQTGFPTADPVIASLE